MSDSMGSEDLAGQLGDLGSEPDPGPLSSGDEGVVADEGPKLSAFAQSYLNTVPDNERDLVQQHVQKWDKGFSKYAERVARQYGQYDQLGDFEQVQQAVQIAQLISQDPNRAVEWLISQGYGPQGQPQQQQPQPQQQFTQEQLNRPVPDVDPRVQAEFNRYQMALGAMNQQLQQDKFNRETERYQSEIERGLEAVKQQHPQIPETMILHLMKGGMEMEEAVGLIVDQVQAGVNQQRAPSAPRVLSSASLPPQAAKPPSEMTDDERKASLLAALQGAVQ